ncbi:MAG: hypothetical protein HFI90_05495 [Clostridia bacterium]|nr:hypothetical protein [Clostridia bacterium]
MTVLDLHADTLLHIDSPCDFAKTQFQPAQALCYDGYLQGLALWVEDGDMHPYDTVCRLLDRLRHAPMLTPVLSPENLSPVVTQNHLPVLLSLENAASLEGSLEKLHTLYHKGVRGVTLTWNGENDVAGGCNSDAGLKPFGRRLIRELERLGMYIDVSHLNDRSFFDVASYAATPLVASHSCSRAICPHPRNLTDEQFRLLLESGGGVGVCFYPLFLNNTKNASLDDIILHIDHFCQLGGGAGVGLGSDFDGTPAVNADLYDSSCYSKLFTELAVHGYTPHDIEQISYRSFSKILRTILKK